MFFSIVFPFKLINRSLLFLSVQREGAKRTFLIETPGRLIGGREREFGEEEGVKEGGGEEWRRGQGGEREGEEELDRQTFMFFPVIFSFKLINRSLLFLSVQREGSERTFLIETPGRLIGGREREFGEEEGVREGGGEEWRRGQGEEREGEKEGEEELDRQTFMLFPVVLSFKLVDTSLLLVCVHREGSQGTFS